MTSFHIRTQLGRTGSPLSPRLISEHVSNAFSPISFPLNLTEPCIFFPSFFLRDTEAARPRQPLGPSLLACFFFPLIGLPLLEGETTIMENL